MCAVAIPPLSKLIGPVLSDPPLRQEAAHHGRPAEERIVPRLKARWIFCRRPALRRVSTSWSYHGGSGSGKTTMLNTLSRFIPEAERVVTIEDTAELQMQQEHVVRLETRPMNIEGRRRSPQRDLRYQRAAHASRPHHRWRSAAGAEGVRYDAGHEITWSRTAR